MEVPSLRIRVISFSLRFALGLKFGYLYSDAKIIKNDKIQNKNARKNWGECDVSLFFDDNMGLSLHVVDVVFDAAVVKGDVLVAGY